MFRVLCFWLIKFYVYSKWTLLGGYYARLAVQAQYLYRSSQIFRDRWQQMGIEYAEQSFKDDLGGIGQHFFWKAQHSPWLIKKQLILDWLLNRTERPYFVNDF